MSDKEETPTDETQNELKTIISNLEKQLKDEQNILDDYYRRTETQKGLVKTLKNAVEILKTIEVEE